MDDTSEGPITFQNSRAHFEPLGFTPASSDLLPGTPGSDTINGDEPTSVVGLPGALAFWGFDIGAEGVFGDERGGSDATAYQLVGGSAVQQTDPVTRPGPDGTADGALAFNGEDTFGFISHDPIMEVTQGTVSLWVQPDVVSKGQAIVLSKDQSGTGDGGHFRLGHQDNGRVFLRFAEGDGGSNKAWESSEAYLSEGQWTHLAVSFTEDGITVYVDGVAVPDYAWVRKEGNLDSPAQATEAYILQNEEPWLLGTDTSATKNNDTPAAFAADSDDLDDAFDGAIADFGLWGGFMPDAALDAAQVWQLFTEGPGDALTAPSGPQPMLAGNDVIDGGAGNDVLYGEGGDDELIGGAGSDELVGGYGNDILIGGSEDDVLEGGRGSDLLLGGDGDDLLVSRSDSGEQRIGQLVIGEPTRGDPDNEVNPERQKLYGWEDQPLVGDDIMVGGAGRDTFLFNPQINAKRDIILEHVEDDRRIDWAGVAGENDEVHDHWVDMFGIDTIADYDADEDTIAIIGHTATPVVEHRLIDTDGDGVDDEAISVITVYSKQGAGGGAHTEDLLGQIVVHGDLVNADDIVRESKVTHGIVETVDELQEALAPSGELKTSILSDGSEFIGYDSRDAEGNLGEVIENPELFSSNPFEDSGLFRYASNVPDDVPVAVAVIDELSHPELDMMTFTGNGDDGPSVVGEPGAYVNVAHEGRATGLAQTAGTVAFSFIADTPGDGKQVLFSKDASGYVDGGHLTAWIDDHGCVDVRYQSTTQSVYLKAKNIEHIVAGEEYHFAFTFDAGQAAFYLNGQLEDVEDLSGRPEFALGMTGNTESMVFGASTMNRSSGTLNDLRYFFDGAIDDLVVLDREIYGAEAFKLAAGSLDYIATSDEPPVDEPPVDEPPVDEPPVDGPPVDEPPVDEPPVDGPPVDGPPVDEPPVDEPPVDEPPVDEPPVDEPPVDEPPVDGPPVDEPPVDEPPVDEPPVDEPPVDEAPTEEDLVIVGTRGADELLGGSGDDEIDGGRGADTISGGNGADVIDGGRGSDKLDGGEGDDEISGGSGNDMINGGSGDNEIDGGRGNDSITTQAGDDDISGGKGRDTINSGAGNDVVDGGRGSDNINSGDGADVIDGGRGRDTIRAGNGNDDIDGGSGHDKIDGGAGDDVISGGRGNDIIVGGAGADEIEGGRGKDILVGGAGDDDLTGGRGRDHFVFESIEGASLGLDVVRDFRSGQDKLLVSNDLTLLFDDLDGHTLVTLKDGADTTVGTIDILGDSFNAENDVMKIAADSIASTDLFA